MEENALSEMSFQGVDRHFSSVGTGDKALEHRRWLEFGLGTDAKTLAPIRQGEGDSRTISGDSKGQRVLWRVFLHGLSSREERSCPRRALPFEKRQIGSGVAGFCVARLAALQQSLRLVVAKSVNSVSAFGRKAPFTSLLLLSPPNPLRWALAGPQLGCAATP